MKIENKLIPVSFIVLVLTRLGDIATTLYAVNVLGLTEGNPHINGLAQIFGFTSAMLLYTSLWILLFSCLSVPFFKVKAVANMQGEYGFTRANLTIIYVSIVNLFFATLTAHAVINNLNLILRG